MKKVLSLCVVCKKKKVLLGMKKRGFGEGRWNGFGGKVEDGESVESGAKRELKEEIGIEAKEMSKSGILEFYFENEKDFLEVHVFKVKRFVGDPTETEEMNPRWFDFEEIPYSQMWPDDKYWLPLLLENKLFKGSFLFDKPSTAEHSSEIINYEIKEVEII